MKLVIYPVTRCLHLQVGGKSIVVLLKVALGEMDKRDRRLIQSGLNFYQALPRVTENNHALMSVIERHKESSSAS